MPSVIPTYRIDLSRAFPEVPRRVQSTQEKGVRPITSVTLVLAYLFSGNQLSGPLADLTPEEIYEELKCCCDFYGVDIERVGQWAESLLLPPEQTLPEHLLAEVPRQIRGLTLHAYQLETAAWSALRLGSVLALGCGVGKTITACAAAETAVRIGRCRDDRCVVVAPLNAVSTWKRYEHELWRVFKDVRIVSCDSLHRMTGIDRSIGGAVIFDELHKLKHQERRRTSAAHDIRYAFDWAVGLTGTMLHTGAEGIISMLDLVCPGMSRFFDKWAFGDAFECIAVKKVGNRNRHSLVRPSANAKDSFVQYLKRGVRSLSMASPEVAACIAIPGQERLLEDSWEKPDWIAALAEEHKDDKHFQIFWSPETDYRVYMGGLALALQHERRQEVREAASGLYPEIVDVGDEDLREFLTSRDDDNAFFYEQQIRKWIKLCGLPEFSSVMSQTTREGRFDRVMAQVALPRDDGTVRLTYRFIYAPGSSRTAPKPGPKIDWVERWLKDNPDEPLVVGAAGVQTLTMMEHMLQRVGIDYRLIRGGVGSDDRMKFIDGFDAGEFRVMLLQQVAGSESVDLIRAAYTVLIDHDYSPINYTQFLARTCRQGQTRECEHIDLSFNAVQTQVIRKLILGEEFDAEARAQIEREVRYQSLLAGVA